MFRVILCKRGEGGSCLQKQSIGCLEVIPVAKSAKIAALIPIYAMILALTILIAMLSSRMVSVVTVEQSRPDRACVIIDAGHGGIDSGATSCTGVPESAINLQIAQRLEALLHLLGIKTVMVRTDDVSVYTEGDTIAAQKVSDLKRRVAIVKENSAALLISIHQNYFNDARYAGAQVFYAKTQDSKQLAESLQRCFVENLNPGSNRMAKKAGGIYLMEHIGCTGVLVECGFLSNPADDAKLQQADYQKKICAILATELSTYLYSKLFA